VFSIASYLVTVASIFGALCINTPANNSKPEKTQLLNVYTEPVKKYYKPVYIDMSNEVNDNSVETNLPIKKLSHYQK